MRKTATTFGSDAVEVLGVFSATEQHNIPHSRADKFSAQAGGEEYDVNDVWNAGFCSCSTAANDSTVHTSHNFCL